MWFDLKADKEEHINVSQFIKKNGDINWEGWMKNITERGRIITKKSNEWQEQALKKAKIRV